MAAVIPYPRIDPVLLHIWGPLEIRWYALAYMTGLLLGVVAHPQHGQAEEPVDEPALQRPRPPATADDIGDLLVWVTFGVILGGRIGYVLIYGIILCSVTPDSSGVCQNLPMDYVTHPGTCWKCGTAGCRSTARRWV